jgi:hypothetical protein
MRISLRSLSRGLLVAAALVAGGAGVAAAPAVASASSYNCTTSGAGLPWYGLNSAYTCLEIDGSGDTVWGVAVNWIGAGTICNYKFQIRFFNDNGKQYGPTQTSPEHVGCRAAAAKFQWNFGRNEGGGFYAGVHKQTGQVCGYLLESGKVRQGVPCGYIHP